MSVGKRSGWTHGLATGLLRPTRHWTHKTLPLQSAASIKHWLYQALEALRSDVQNPRDEVAG
ncbi:hypothetical protein GGP62_003326 [Salinibacter ruber]|nr:hypothetical protein [Salinibacter ruber]